MDVPKNEWLSWKIAEYLIENNYFDEYYGYIGNALDWLSLCSSLNTVEIQPNRFDEGLLYCGSAWQHEVDRSKLHSLVTTELVRFHFAWGAMEHMLPTFFDLSKAAKGKIGKLCEHLKMQQLEQVMPDFYEEEYGSLISLLLEANEYSEDLRALGINETNLFPSSPRIDTAGAGIYVVYKIRNRFAHGAMRFPEPEEYCGEPPRTLDIIVISTRIVLMTILLLLIGDLRNSVQQEATKSNRNNTRGIIHYLRSLCTSESADEPFFNYSFFED